MLLSLYRKLYAAFHRNRAVQEWKQFEYFDQRWKSRIKAMAGLIGNERTVLDLGCGKMWLREHLAPEIQYFPCDYAPRDAQTLVCDFNRGEFPSLRVDLCFASGVMEYVKDVPWFIAKIAETCRVLILSYTPTEISGDIDFRKSLGWQNHLSRQELRTLLAEAGFMANGSHLSKEYEILRLENKG